MLVTILLAISKKILIVKQPAHPESEQPVGHGVVGYCKIVIAYPSAQKVAEF